MHVILGDVQIDTPDSNFPVSKWIPIHTRMRTALDFGRQVFDSSAESLGQLFVSISLLDPLQLTAIGESTYYPEGDNF